MQKAKFAVVLESGKATASQINSLTAEQSKEFIMAGGQMVGSVATNNLETQWFSVSAGGTKVKFGYHNSVGVVDEATTVTVDVRPEALQTLQKGLTELSSVNSDLLEARKSLKSFGCYKPALYNNAGQAKKGTTYGCNCPVQVSTCLRSPVPHK